MGASDTIETIIELIQKAMPFVAIIVTLIKDENIRDALLSSDKVTDEQKAIITAMRTTAMDDWKNLAPTSNT